MTLERRGVPTAAIITDAFSKYAQGISRMQGMEQLPVIVIPHPVAVRPPEELRGKIRKIYEELRVALVKGND